MCKRRIAPGCDVWSSVHPDLVDDSDVQPAPQQLGKKRGCLFYGIAAFVGLWLFVFCGGIIWFFVCLFFSVKIGTEVYQAPSTQEFLHGEKPAAVKTLESDETP